MPRDSFATSVYLTIFRFSILWWAFVSDGLDNHFDELVLLHDGDHL